MGCGVGRGVGVSVGGMVGMGVAVRVVGSGRLVALGTGVAVLWAGWVVTEAVGKAATGWDVGRGWVTVQPTSNKIELKTKQMMACFMENFLNRNLLL